MGNRKSKDLRWLFGLVFLFGLFLIFQETSSLNTQNSSQPSKPSRFQQEDPKKLNLVNRHLKETALTLEHKKLQQQQEANRILDRYSNSYQQNTYEQNSGLSFETDTNMQRLTDELNRSVELSDNELTPEQIIHNELLNRQLLDKENRAYTEAYMKQFVENARAGGWEIKLGPNLEVLSVKKLKPRRPSLINQ